MHIITPFLAKKKTNKKKKKSQIMLLRHKSEIAQQVVDPVNHHLG